MTQIKALNEYPDKVRLTEIELDELQQGRPVVAFYKSLVDIMTGQYDTVELLILPS